MKSVCLARFTLTIINCIRMALLIVKNLTRQAYRLLLCPLQVDRQSAANILCSRLLILPSSTRRLRVDQRRLRRGESPALAHCSARIQKRQLIQILTPSQRHYTLLRHLALTNLLTSITATMTCTHRIQFPRLLLCRLPMFLIVLAMT
jgi:hypothetical protein